MSAHSGDVRIRRATPADIDVLAHVGSESFRDAYGSHASAADLDSHVQQSFSAQAIRHAFASGDCDYYLARVAGKPAGMARVRMAACPVPGGDANALELQQLYVLAEMRRHGLGCRLIEQVLEHATGLAAAGVWLSAWEFADWAVRFYTSVGFVSIGKVEFRLGSTVHTDLLMWRPL